MEKIARTWVMSVIVALLQTNSYKAEKYISNKLVVRATRRFFKGKIVKGNVEVLLVVGKPNYEQRETIRKNKGVMPKGVVLKNFPKKKK